MDCLSSKRDTPEKQMDFLLGQNGGFTSAEHKLFYLSLLCVQKVNSSDKSGSNQRALENADYALGLKDNIHSDSGDREGTEHSENRKHFSEEEMKLHVCNLISKNEENVICGCDLFIPNTSLPAILFQQTYNKWKAALDLNFQFRQMRKKRNIYIQPLESFPSFISEFSYSFKDSHNTGFFNFLRDFLQIYFQGFNVCLLETKTISEYGWNVKMRYHEKTQKEQFLVKDIYSNLKKVLPNDGFCSIGITWTDLYPCEELNFVLGEASSQHKCAAFCFGRYEPKAYKDGKVPPPIEEITGDIIWRMIKVISHETCHLFSVKHCVFFHCSMNESTSLEEALSQPLFMCPVCLRKMQKVCQFDIVKRYQDLHVFLQSVQQQYPSDKLFAAIMWLEKCLNYMNPNDS